MGLLVAKSLLAFYHALVEPALAIGLRRSRLETLSAVRPLASVSLRLGKDHDCSPKCRSERKDDTLAARRYLGAPRREDAGWPARVLRDLDHLRRPTPMVVDLARYPTAASFEAVLRKRSSRTLAKARRAAEAGYRVKTFPRLRHTLDIYAIRTSKAFRTAGPVLDYFLLRQKDVGVPKDVADEQAPRCPRHWTRLWGVFRDAPGHRQGELTTDEELVAYIRMRRSGDVVHYVDIMGHADHLAGNVMILLHLEIMRWLIAGEGHAAGVRVVLYGGLEHGGEGLLVWKKRAGFEPSLLVRQDRRRRGWGAKAALGRLIGRRSGP